MCCAFAALVSTLTASSARISQPTHLCQNLSAHYCLALHDKRSPLDLQKTSGADAGSRQAKSIFSGVTAYMYLGSELARVNGRQLTHAQYRWSKS